jgi:hypothetical protein
MSCASSWASSMAAKCPPRGMSVKRRKIVIGTLGPFARISRFPHRDGGRHVDALAGRQWALDAGDHLIASLPCLRPAAAAKRPVAIDPEGGPDRLRGTRAQSSLEAGGLPCNKNWIPGDAQPLKTPSGVRLVPPRSPLVR